MNTGERIRNLREDIDMLQQELADATGINVSVLNRIEKGTRAVRDDELAIISRKLNVSADYLLGNSDDPTPRDSAASRQPAAHSDSDAPSSPRLSEREQVHIRYYRTLTEAHKDDVDDMTKRWSAQDNEKGTATHAKDGDGMTTAEESSQHTAS